MPVDPNYPYIGQWFIPCELSCGCHIQWYDGTELKKDVYYYCKTHGDVAVKVIYTAPTILDED